VRSWIVDRFGLGPIWDHFLDRDVPKDPWYHGDGMALLLLLAIQVVTGAILALTYTPSTTEAYESVYYITHRQLLGWFIRGLHYWSGGLMVAMLLVHVCRQVAFGGYKPPREGTWLVGVVLLVLVVVLSFLGYVLRWDDRGITGLRVAMSILERVPAMGDQLVVLVLGGPEMNTLTLTRVFALHVILLPLVLLPVVAYHVYLVVIHGTTIKAEQQHPVETAEEQREIYEREKEHPARSEVFFPTAILKMSPWSVIVFSTAVVLTLTLGAPALLPHLDLSGVAAPAEEWWFAWYSALVALLPPSISPAFQVIFPIGLLLLLVLLPFVDRSPHRGWRNRPVATTVCALTITAIVVLSGMRIQSEWTGWPGSEAPAIPPHVELTAEAEHGRMLFTKYGCTSCHRVAGSGTSKVGTDLAHLEHRYSQEELRQYVLHPPADVAMPGYAGRISDEELDAVVAFVLVAQTFPRTPE
jgi:ubiquinol-cytochrome c reductase cytochrome b subunit